MGRVAVVLSFERGTDPDGKPKAEVKCDPGGEANLTADHFGAAGDDSPPLPGDFVALEDSTGSGGEQATGYQDPKNAGTAEPGEVRRYARDADGVPVCEFHLKANGDIDIRGIKTGGKVTINGVEFLDGGIKAPGEITAKSDTTPVNVSTHLHPTGMGPSGAPTPGT